MKIKGMSASAKQEPIEHVVRADPRGPGLQSIHVKLNAEGTTTPPPPGSSFQFSTKQILYEGKTYVRVFVEDEVLLHDPTASHISDAVCGYCGVSYGDLGAPDVHEDGGDSFIDLYREHGMIVLSSFDGSSLFLDQTRLPFAALFGGRWRFEDWKRVSEGLCKMRDPDPHHSSTTQLVVLGDMAHTIAGMFQNQRPMTKAEIDEAEELLGRFEDQVPSAMDELNALVSTARHTFYDAILTKKKRG